MAVFLLFFVELITMRYAQFGHSHDHDVEDGPGHDANSSPTAYHDDDVAKGPVSDRDGAEVALDSVDSNGRQQSHMPGDDHLGHSREHQHRDSVDAGSAHRTTVKQNSRAPKTFDPDSYAAQMTAIMILEFGVIFHSVFIGLTLAVSGEEFDTLYVVLVFHQTFEGLALGSRLASIVWPKSKRWTPYYLGMGYAISTPISIAIGLGVRTTFSPGSQTTLIVNGVFDSISAGILIYTGLVELMAHEFMFSSYMQRAPIREVLSAVGVMALGAGLMALLGKWA